MLSKSAEDTISAIVLACKLPLKRIAQDVDLAQFGGEFSVTVTQTTVYSIAAQSSLKDT